MQSGGTDVLLPMYDTVTYPQRPPESQASGERSQTLTWLRVETTHLRHDEPVQCATLLFDNGGSSARTWSDILQHAQALADSGDSEAQRVLKGFMRAKEKQA